MTVMALLRLEYQRTPALESRPAIEILRWNRQAAPRVHHGAPRSVFGQMSQSAQRDRNDQNCQDRDWPALPTLLTLARNEWQPQQHDDSNGGADQQYRRLSRRRQKGQQRIQPQEEEVWTRSGLDNRGVGLAAGTEGPQVNCTEGDRKQYKTGKYDIFPDRARHERHAVFLYQLVVLLNVGGSAHDASRHGPFVDSQLQHHEQVDADESDQKSGDDKHVQREEARESRTGDDRTAQHEIYSPRPNDGNATCDRRPNPQSPISVLVEAQHLAGKRHAERYEQKKHSDDPRKFPRKLVRSKKKDLHHVDQDDCNHEIRAPPMQSPNEPAERNGVVENLQAVPGFSGGRHVDERQQNSGNDLQNEDH